MNSRFRLFRVSVVFSCFAVLLLLSACAAKVQRLGNSLEEGMSEEEVRRVLRQADGPKNVVEFQFQGDTVQVLQYAGHPLHGSVYDIEYLLVNGRYRTGGAYENDFDHQRVYNLRTYLATHNDSNLKRLEKGMEENEVQEIMGVIPRPDVPQPASTTAFNDAEGNVYRIHRYYTQEGRETTTPVILRNGVLEGIGRDSPAFQRHEKYLLQ